MKLNLAAGEDRRDGWLSVDLRRDIADVVADVRHLPFADGSVDELLALDCLEHFPADQTVALLAEWRRVLASGGVLTLRVPNLYQLCRQIVSRCDIGRYDSVAVIIRNIYGGHRWGPEGSLDAHHTGWVPQTLHDELIRAGFEVLVDDGALNNTVIARKL